MGRLAVPEFLAALDHLAQLDCTLGTRLHLLSLADLRGAVGEKWARLAEKVGWVADSIIRRHLAEGDLFTQADEQTFIVAMPGRSRDEARGVITAIAHELSSRILGRHTVGGARPSAIVANIALSEAVNGAGRIDADVVARAIASQQSLLHADRTSQPLALSPLVRPSGRAVRVCQLMDQKTAPRAESDPAWQAFHVEAKVRQDHGPSPLSAEASLALVWRPTWVSETEAISAYAARVIRVDGDDRPTLEGSLAYAANDGPGTLILDRFVVAQAVRDLLLAPAMARCSVIVPMSWRSLASPSRHDILRPFAELTEQTRKQRLTVEIFNIPDEIAETDLIEIGRILKRVGCELLVRQHLADPPCPLVSRWQADLGVELAELKPEERVGDDQLLSRVEAMRERAGAVGAQCYLWGARRRRVIGRLVERGFHMVNGPGLMEDVGRPAMVVPAPRSRLILAA